MIYWVSVWGNICMGDARSKFLGCFCGDTNNMKKEKYQWEILCLDWESLSNYSNFNMTFDFVSIKFEYATLIHLAVYSFLINIYLLSLLKKTWLRGTGTPTWQKAPISLSGQRPKTLRSLRLKCYDNFLATCVSKSLLCLKNTRTVEL